MASPRNQHCASCIGTLSFPIHTGAAYCYTCSVVCVLHCVDTGGHAVFTTPHYTPSTVVSTSLTLCVGIRHTHTHWCGHHPTLRRPRPMDVARSVCGIVLVQVATQCSQPHITLYPLYLPHTLCGHQTHTYKRSGAATIPHYVDLWMYRGLEVSK